MEFSVEEVAFTFHLSFAVRNAACVDNVVYLPFVFVFFFFCKFLIHFLPYSKSLAVSVANA